MIKLNVTMVTDLLLAAVRARGFDYQYKRVEDMPGCLYVHDTEKPQEEWTPGCIVGYVLNRAGVTLAQLKEYEHDHAASVLGKLRMAGILEIDETSISLLRSVQVKQDDEQSWGPAVITSLGKQLWLARDDVDRMKKVDDDRVKRLAQIRDLTYTY